MSKSSESANKYSLYIPRASLSSSSGLSSKSSSRSREFSPNPMDRKGKRGSRNVDESESEGIGSSSIDEKKSSYGDNKMCRKANHPMYIVYKGGKPKRTFDSTATQSSSSSSSASNQSNYVSEYGIFLFYFIFFS